jgi:hypothetical protein
MIELIDKSELVNEHKESIYEEKFIGKKIKDIDVEFVPDPKHFLPNIKEITIIMEDDSTLMTTTIHLNHL